MLKQSYILIVRRQKYVHLRSVTNQVDRVKELKERNELTTKSIPIQIKVQEFSYIALAKYNELIGWNEIEQAYKKVTGLQESLHKIQSERTMLQMQMANVRSELASLQSEINDHKRGESKYLELMKKEFEVIQQKNKLEEHYTILDTKEREQFSHLQAMINAWHEKSRIHTRQWGIISTIIGALLGIIGTSVSAYYRNNDIRKIQLSIQTLIQEQIELMKEETQQVTKSYSDLMENLQRFEVILKANVVKAEKAKTIESWAGYLKRKSLGVWRWCTLQKPIQLDNKDA